MNDTQKHNFRLVRSRVQQLTRAERLEYYETVRQGPFLAFAIAAAKAAAIVKKASEAA